MNVRELSGEKVFGELTQEDEWGYFVANPSSIEEKKLSLIQEILGGIRSQADLANEEKDWSWGKRIISALNLRCIDQCFLVYYAVHAEKKLILPDVYGYQVEIRGDLIKEQKPLEGLRRWESLIWIRDASEDQNRFDKKLGLVTRKVEEGDVSCIFNEDSSAPLDEGGALFLLENGNCFAKLKALQNGERKLFTLRWYLAKVLKCRSIPRAEFFSFPIPTDVKKRLLCESWEVGPSWENLKKLDKNKKSIVSFLLGEDLQEDLHKTLTVSESLDLQLLPMDFIDLLLFQSGILGKERELIVTRGRKLVHCATNEQELNWAKLVDLMKVS